MGRGPTTQIDPKRLQHRIARAGLNKKDFALLMGVSVHAVDKWIATKRIPTVRVSKMSEILDKQPTMDKKEQDCTTDEDFCRELYDILKMCNLMRHFMERTLDELEKSTIDRIIQIEEKQGDS